MSFFRDICKKRKRKERKKEKTDFDRFLLRFTDKFSRSRAQVARKRASIVARTDAVREPSAYGTVRYSCAGVHQVPVDRRMSNARQVRDGLLTV